MKVGSKFSHGQGVLSSKVNELSWRKNLTSKSNRKARNIKASDALCDDPYHARVLYYPKAISTGQASVQPINHDLENLGLFGFIMDLMEPVVPDAQGDILSALPGKLAAGVG